METLLALGLERWQVLAVSVADIKAPEQHRAAQTKASAPQPWVGQELVLSLQSSREEQDGRAGVKSRDTAASPRLSSFPLEPL